MTHYWPEIALVVALVVVNGVLAGSEAAYISLREGQLHEFERRGSRRGRAVVRLAREPNRFLATIQLGITLAGFLASATAAVTLAEPLIARLSFLGDAAEIVGITVVTVLVAIFTLVVGELAPKRLAMQHARRWAVLIATPLEVLSVAARPVVWLLGKATDVVVRLLGGDPSVGREELTVDELRQLITGHRGLSAEQRTIIAGALEIHERRLRQVIVPRPAVRRLDATLSVEQARADLAASGHIRAPVVASGDLDDVLGVVHLRDLLGSSGTVNDVMRPVLNFPDSLRVSSALSRFMAEHEHFAVVIDERGSVAGIVTLEDLLEEIVGEIYDEADRDIWSVKAMPDGSLLLPGTFPIHDLPDVGVDRESMPKGDYTTVAGFVVAALGRIPTAPGDRVGLSDCTIEVTAVSRHAITGVRLSHQSGR
ncbi:hemolysin family protein [Mycolicibacterium gadium]|jgi:putative hemolysin|uniref:hemolysin family protein n=1 Tax=Mycolicibacterium gadium TaxID=1794 RepID=UPI002FDF0948